MLPWGLPAYMLTEKPSKSHHHSNLVFSHEWSFLQGEKKHTHTLKAGHHSFPFSLTLNGTLPATLATQNHDAIIIYKMRATAVRSGLASNLHAEKLFTLHRTFTSDALEFNQTLEIENTWPGKMMYALTLPFKAYAAGDEIPVLIKFMPLAKGVKVTAMVSEIAETAVVSSKHSSRSSTRQVMTVRHDLSSGKPELVTEEASHPPLGWTGLRVAQSRHRSRPSSPTREPNTDEEVAQGLERGDDEINSFLYIAIPPWTTPSHTVAPVLVSHKVKWSCTISNADGHVSELRCALPIIILDQALLSEARSAGAATRNLLFGREDHEAPAELPSYTNHVYDRVAVAAPSAMASGPSSTSNTPPVSRGPSRPSSPSHEDDEVPARRELTSFADEQLLLSLGALASSNISPRDTPGTSRTPSRPSSRHNSRPPSPERQSSSSSLDQMNSRHHAHSHSSGHHHGFKIHLPHAFKPLGKAASSKPILRNFSGSSMNSSSEAMRRTSSAVSMNSDHGSQSAHSPHAHPHGSHTHSRAHTPVNGHSQSRGATRVSFANQGTGHDWQDRHDRGSRRSSAQFHFAPEEDDRADPISQVPSYAIASRGFLGGGVVPLDQRLPTYDASEQSTANSRRSSISLVRPRSDTSLVNLGTSPLGTSPLSTSPLSPYALGTSPSSPSRLGASPLSGPSA